MGCISLVEQTLSYFSERADDALVACFAESVRIYSDARERALPVIASRAELQTWLARARQRFAAIDVQLLDTEKVGRGVVCDVIVESGAPLADVWRVPVAISCEDGVIEEVRAFVDRAAASTWLLARA